jgi:hypothetical protein
LIDDPNYCSIPGAGKIFPHFHCVETDCGPPNQLCYSYRTILIWQSESLCC